MIHFNVYRLDQGEHVSRHPIATIAVSAPDDQSIWERDLLETANRYSYAEEKLVAVDWAAPGTRDLHETIDGKRYITIGGYVLDPDGNRLYELEPIPAPVPAVSKEATHA